MELDEDLIARMKALFQQGKSPTEIVRWLLDQPSPESSLGRIHAIAYLVRAFRLSAGDASTVGAWEVFPGGTWSQAQVDSVLWPRIREAEPDWGR